MMVRLLAVLSLLICLSAPFLFFWGQIGETTFRTVFALSSLAWFVFATPAVRQRSPR